jgi:hypothetical protein
MSPSPWSDNHYDIEKLIDASFTALVAPKDLDMLFN